MSTWGELLASRADQGFSYDQVMDYYRKTYPNSTNSISNNIVLAQVLSRSGSGTTLLYSNGVKLVTKFEGNLNQSLCKDYTLLDFLKSNTADKRGYKEQYAPPDNIVTNLSRLAINIVQPIVDFIGKKVSIQSGYRCPRVNSDPDVGGVSDSQHQSGEACDIIVIGKSPSWLYQKIIDSGIVFDQLLLEPTVVHISTSPTPRKLTGTWSKNR